MSKRITKKMKKKKIMVSRAIFGILILLSIIFFGIVLYLNVVPKKYLLPITGGYIFYLLISGILQCISSGKIEVKSFFNIISCILIIILNLGIFYMYKTINFMNIIGASDYELDNYYVVVLKDYHNDINGKLVGRYSIEDNYTSALNELEQKKDFHTKKYDNFIDAAKALLEEEINALFISEAHKNIVDEQISNFNDSVKIIDTISIKVKNEVENKDVNITKDPFNIYISGIDVYGDISSVSRSDVNMIVTVNPKTHKILLTSIPRDYYVRLHGTTGYKDKLTHAGLYGIDMSIETIEDLLEIDINYYVRVNFTTLIELVDAIGGIDIYSDKELTAYTNNNCKYIKGNNHVDGKCALAFARERFAYSTGDRHRVQNQQDIIKAIINKTLNSKTLITKYTSILKTLGDSFETSIPSNQIYELINMQLDEMPNWEIEQISLDGTNSSNYTYSYSAGKLYVMEPDINTIYKAQEKIKETTNLN